MFADLVRKARTYRRFDESTPIPAETLRDFVDLARLVPCGGNSIKAAFNIPESMNVHLVLAIGEPAEKVVIEPMPPDGNTAYWRSGDGVHHVPKRGLDEVLVDYARTCS